MGSVRPSRRTGQGDRNRDMIVRFVREFGYREGHPPSLREIGDGIGLAVSTISYHLAVLQRAGALRRSAGSRARLSSVLIPGCRPMMSWSKCR